MRVRGEGPFGNDVVADWMVDLVDADDLTVALDALDRVQGAPYVDDDDAAVAIAAAEVVAAAAGRPRADLPDAVHDWLSSTEPGHEPVHSERAAAAIERVRGEDSEQAERWAEAAPGDRAAWHSSLDDLYERLGT